MGLLQQLLRVAATPVHHPRQSVSFLHQQVQTLISYCRRSSKSHGHQGRMLSTLYPLPDPISERAFQLHYGKAGMMLDLLEACVRLLSLLAMLIAACWRVTNSTSWTGAAAKLVCVSSWWMNLAMQTSIPLVYATLGPEKYILSRGAFSIVHRVLYAMGVASVIRPGDCK